MPNNVSNVLWTFQIQTFTIFFHLPSRELIIFEQQFFLPPVGSVIKLIREDLTTKDYIVQDYSDFVYGPPSTNEVRVNIHLKALVSDPLYPLQPETSPSSPAFFQKIMDLFKKDRKS